MKSANQDGKADEAAATMPSKEEADEVDNGGEGEDNDGGMSAPNVREEGTV